MSKPEDVTQDVWDKAFYHMDDFALLSWIDGDDELLFQRCISEAIQAAKLEAYQEAAKVVDAMTKDHLTGSRNPINVLHDLALSIRKLGEGK